MTQLSPLARAVALACAALGAATASAQQVTPANEGLSEVVVTATRASKAVEKIPGAVSVISQRELASQYALADDPSAALALYVPGYAPSRQKLTSQGESLRGRQPLILLDGIPQSNPLRNGAREGYFADSAIIERIEVINGASAIQGMGATGGIINYITKSPRKLGTTSSVHVRATSQFESDSVDWKTGYSVAHKTEAVDLFAYAGVQRRGVAYDGEGRRVGLDAVQGDTMNSRGDDVFFKIGKDFGDQRLQLSVNRFEMEGQGEYRTVRADLAAGIPTSSERGTPPGTPPRNQASAVSLDYRHNSLGGGALSTQLFKQDFTALYGAATSSTFQDASIAPIGTLYDQSEIVADKRGAKLTYVRPDTLVDGLEATVGLDYLHDNTQQRLAITDRTWVPPLEFTSTAPFAQLEYEYGAFTVRGGLRREFAKLNVDTYTTLAAYNNTLVQGGSTSFAETVANLGVVWRVGGGWSVFASSAEGFGLPDAGLVLRGINRPNQSVPSLISLEPIVTRNNEVGATWRGVWGTVGASYYDSRSDVGSVIRVVNGIGHVDRVPTHVKGWELSGEVKLSKTLSAFGSYATTRGTTAIAQGQPLDVALGARNQGPDKAVLGANWQFAPRASVRMQATHLADRDINQGRFAGASNLEEHFDGYTVADAIASFDTRYGQFGVGIENLFDRQYIHYYSQSSTLDKPINTFAGRGRTLAVNWHYQF